jgi:exopolyphosphatase/guanosine-5'-triphosphate,3'-diphosphate pyrophosphatase
MESLPMGCVSYMRFFPDGRIDKQSMKRAELAASNETERIVREFKRTGWREAVGSSGTVKSLAGILAANGWAEQGLTAAGLERLRAHLIKSGDLARLDLPGLRDDRATILPGGLAIMSAVFAALELEHMSVSEGALRQGVLYDLLGRYQRHDMREVTVRQFMRRHHVDSVQAERVAGFAVRLYRELFDSPREADELILRWAAQLHEIGLTIAHAAYHKHSAYILSNADMPGFSKDDQARLARVVLAHRGKLTKLEGLSMRSTDWDLVFCLRTAALFYRSRVDVELPRLACRETESGFQLALSASWLDAHPLTASALESEADDWKALGMRLEVKTLAAEKVARVG